MDRCRATLGNESVSIGGEQGGMSMPGSMMVTSFDEHPDRLTGGEGRIGRYVAQQQAMGLLNLRARTEPWPERAPAPRAMTKLILSEIGHERRRCSPS
jgi:hypothetical protein